MKLNVLYKGNTLAGTLHRDEKGFHFLYDKNFLEAENTFAISVNLPKRSEEYFSEELFPNFQSMLSEGYNREMQCRSLGIDPDDDWSLLMYTCSENTIGAITVQRTEE